MKWGTWTKKASIQGSEEHVLKKIQHSKVRKMYLKIFNAVKWETCTQEASEQVSQFTVLKLIQYNYLTSLN